MKLHVTLVLICLLHVVSYSTRNFMRISSYNCQSSKRNSGGIQLLCNSSDIIFLQEHWLFPNDLPTLNTIHSDFISLGISSMSVDDGIILGRPYGGIAVMWRKQLASKVKPVLFKDDRIIGLECLFDNIKMLFLGVYLPYNSYKNFEDFVFTFGKIQSIIEDFDSPNVFVMGDFNADIEKETVFGKELVSFCQDSDLVIADRLYLPSGSVTHINEGHGTESWIDHALCTKSGLDILQNVEIGYSVASSDHFPITVSLRLSCSELKMTPERKDVESPKMVVDWCSVDKNCLEQYSAGVEDRLSAVHVPLDVLNCMEKNCESHKEDIDQYYAAIISCLYESSCSNIAKQVRMNRKSIPGWSEFVQKAHSTLGDIYCLWALVGKPRNGYIFNQLRLAKSRFKYALRWCIRNEKDLRAKSLADKLARYPRDAPSFWKEVRKLNSSPPLASTIGGVSGAEDIGEMWKDHFKRILNSVQNSELKSSVLSKLCEDESAMVNISVQEVRDSVRELASGKSGGHDGLNSEHFKFAGHSCVTHLSLCFTMMLRHCHLPNELTKVILVPILKDKTGNISDKDNYRPIALASVSSKLLETIILNRSKIVLQTSDHQFGFKPGHSTDMAIYAVKEITEYYLRSNSPVFICYLDATKAFDRVNHWKLFDKLYHATRRP